MKWKMYKYIFKKFIFNLNVDAYKHCRFWTLFKVESKVQLRLFTKKLINRYIYIYIYAHTYIHG
jgi:hypothetical protein